MTGAQLKQIREKQFKLSQSGLAQLLGVTIRTLSRWENDSVSPPPYVELALAELKRRKR